MKRACRDIIINEALCSVGKKVCYILLPSAKLGLLLEKNLFVHLIKGKPDKMSDLLTTIR